MRAKTVASGARSPGVNPALLLIICVTLSKMLHPLCLSLLNCKVGIIIVLPPRVGVSIELTHEECLQ